jgi:hypothetical protein
MTQSRQSVSPTEPVCSLMPDGPSFGDCMAMASMLQADATRLELQMPELADLIKAKRDVAALLERIGTGLVGLE